MGSGRDQILKGFEQMEGENTNTIEDAYDDSKAVFDRQRVNSDPKRVKGDTGSQGEKQDVEGNPVRFISNNNMDHLNPTIEQPSVSRRQIADASTNTIIFSNDIDALQERAESAERAPKSQKSVATNTLNDQSPRPPKDLFVEDAITSIIHELEQGKTQCPNKSA